MRLDISVMTMSAFGHDFRFSFLSTRRATARGKGGRAVILRDVCSVLENEHSIASIARMAEPRASLHPLISFSQFRYRSASGSRLCSSYQSANCSTRVRNDTEDDYQEANRKLQDFEEYSPFAKVQIVWLHGKAEQYTLGAR